MNRTHETRSRKRSLFIALSLAYVALACVTSIERGPRHTWWEGLGPVLPHDTFPTECTVCHVGTDWQTLKPDFAFDHEAETGVALVGAHQEAHCLRCHNDRGPVAAFSQQGCMGCHEDLHLGQLGNDCESCHNQNTWYPSGMVERHNRTRLPLSGVHAVTQCRRCHPAAEAGRFLPQDVQCVSCHQEDLAQALNPPHALLGQVDPVWVTRCDDCHRPTAWSAAQTQD